MRGLPLSGRRIVISRRPIRVGDAPARTRAKWSQADRPYTPVMRRVVCVAALLLGFSGNRDVWSIRPRMTVPVVQPVRLAEAGGTVRGPAWWLR